MQLPSCYCRFAWVVVVISAWASNGGAGEPTARNFEMRYSESAAVLDDLKASHPRVSIPASFLEIKAIGQVVDFGFRVWEIPAEAEPRRTVADEVALLEHGRVHAQQNALRRLGSQADPRADEILLGQFERLEAGQLPPALWLELIEAATMRDSPALRKKLVDRERTLERAADPLARYRECLEGGDGDEGRRTFTTKEEAGCVRCHSVDGKGGQIGPELTSLRHSVERLHILESVIVPNATIASGYDPAMLTLANGEEIAGVVSLETEDVLTLTSVADGKKREIKTADIVRRTPLPSPMPPFFGTVLSKREIRDLIEFLAEGD